jgi:hypothetical protein
MDVYPDAKVLLSVRSAESWVESMHNTIAQIWFVWSWQRVAAPSEPEAYRLGADERVGRRPSATTGAAARGQVSARPA